MLHAVLVLSVLNGAPEGIDQIVTVRGMHAWDLEWSDAEDRVHGFIRPLDPVEGQPLEISFQVGAFQGDELDIPVTVSMRCLEWSATQTLTRAKDSKSWLAVFTPQGNGDCHIDMGWQTTRHKLVHTVIRVTPAPLSRAPWYALVGLVAAAALGLGIRAALRKPEDR